MPDGSGVLVGVSDGSGVLVGVSDGSGVLVGVSDGVVAPGVAVKKILSVVDVEAHEALYDCTETTYPSFGIRFVRVRLVSVEVKDVIELFVSIVTMLYESIVHSPPTPFFHVRVAVVPFGPTTTFRLVGALGDPVDVVSGVFVRVGVGVLVSDGGVV